MAEFPKRFNSGKVIGTHNGTFHCDEVTACFMLRQLPEYSGCKIVRSRDPTELTLCDIVVDVGAEYDPGRHRYDHHQRTFNETFHTICHEKPWNIKLSSAGLIFLHFGHRVLSEMTKLPETDPLLCKLYDKMYEDFILEIDAIDNGIAVSDGTLKYRIGSNLSLRVSYLNPWWNQPDIKEDDRFNEALDMVGREFTDRLRYFHESWWPARKLVEDALTSRTSVHPSGEIMVMGQGGCPWKSHLFELEQQELAAGGDEGGSTVLFVLYEDKGGSWRVQAIPPDENHGFEQRLGLLEEWRGIRDEDLSIKSGIDNCIFVHAGGFIGGNKTYEGALNMAIKTIEMSKK